MSAITITRTLSLDMGHALADHEGQCHHLHGHTYRVFVSVSGPLGEPGSPDSGMVLDFADVKAAMQRAIVDRYDHRFVMHSADPRVPLVKAAEPDLLILHHPPTAELLAQRWAREVQRALESTGITVTACTVWETPNCYATWEVE